MAGPGETLGGPTQNKSRQTKGIYRNNNKPEQTEKKKNKAKQIGTNQNKSRKTKTLKQIKTNQNKLK
jgi:hypothetical protein